MSCPGCELTEEANIDLDEAREERFESKRSKELDKKKKLTLCLGFLLATSGQLILDSFLITVIKLRGN